MVQELDHVRSKKLLLSDASCQRQAFSRYAEELESLPNASIPILFKRRNQQDKQTEKDELLPYLKKACYFLASQVKSIRQNAHKLARIDPLTERVTRPLENRCKAIIFEPLNDDSGFRINALDQPISLNINTALKLTEAVSQKVNQDYLVKMLGLALTVFLLHELSHISQRLKYYDDVKRMKKVSEDFGRARMGEIDLRSDFLAVHTLAYHLALRNGEVPSQRVYIKYFHLIWCTVCRSMITTFPFADRKDKQQRMFGYLLMSNLIRDAYEGNYPLEFNGELYCEWSDSLDWLSIFSGGYPLGPGSSVDPEIMRQILADFLQGKFNHASICIEEIWSHYPRR